MALNEVKAEVIIDFNAAGSNSPRIYVDNTGNVVIYNSSSAWAPSDHEFHRFLEARNRAVTGVTEIRSEIDNLSRDERTMFELLTPWQQWSFLVMRYRESVLV